MMFELGSKRRREEDMGRKIEWWESENTLRKTGQGLQREKKSTKISNSRAGIDDHYHTLRINNRILGSFIRREG